VCFFIKYNSNRQTKSFTCCFYYSITKKKKMKLRVVGILVAVLALGTIFTGCGKEDLTPKATALLQTGAWRVVVFKEDGNDQTQHFTGYAFHFGSEGTVTATYGNNTVNGTWNTGNDGSSNKIILDFGSDATFEEISEDWEIKEVASFLIELEHTSGGNGGTDVLHFEKM
jgi:hypothetical protein